MADELEVTVCHVGDQVIQGTVVSSVVSVSLALEEGSRHVIRTLRLPAESPQSEGGTSCQQPPECTILEVTLCLSGLWWMATPASISSKEDPRAGTTQLSYP